MGILLDGGGRSVPMKRVSHHVVRLLLSGLFLALATTPSGALPPTPEAAPAVIAVPDCTDGFTMDVRPRRNPESLGTVTRDGYPVLLGGKGENHYILSRGADIYTPTDRNGYLFPDYVPNGPR